VKLTILKKRLKNCYIDFNEESFQISKDKAGKKHYETVKYPFVHCLNKYQEYYLYFKSKLNGYCLIFDEEQKNKGVKCYKNLLVMQDQNVLTKKKKLKIGEKVFISINLRSNQFFGKFIFLFRKNRL
jgi:hypothetical protein